MEGKHVPGEGREGTIRSTTYGFKSRSVHEKGGRLRGQKIQPMGLIHLQIENIFLNLVVAPPVSLLYTREATHDQRGCLFTCAQRHHMGSQKLRSLKYGKSMRRGETTLIWHTTDSAQRGSLGLTRDRERRLTHVQVSCPLSCPHEAVHASTLGIRRSRKGAQTDLLGKWSWAWVTVKLADPEISWGTMQAGTLPHFLVCCFASPFPLPSDTW